MKLEVGMYVRTKDDGIQKITKVTENGCFYRTCTAGFEYKTSLSDKEDIVSEPSFEIMELIKIGDVFLDSYGRKKEVFGKEYNEEYQEWRLYYSLCWYLTKDKIKKVLTKEQFENSSFKVSD